MKKLKLILPLIAIVVLVFVLYKIGVIKPSFQQSSTLNTSINQSKPSNQTGPTAGNNLHNEPLTLKTYQSILFGFTFKYSANLLLDKKKFPNELNPVEEIITLTDESERPENSIFVSCAKIPQSMMDQYPNLRKLVDNFLEGRKNIIYTDTTLSGLPAIKVTGDDPTGINDKIVTLKFNETATLKGSTFCALGYSIYPNSENKLVPFYPTILNSFRI